VRFQVLTVSSTKFSVFQVVAPCSLVETFTDVSEVLAAYFIMAMVEAASKLFVYDGKYVEGFRVELERLRKTAGDSVYILTGRHPMSVIKSLGSDSYSVMRCTVIISVGNKRQQKCCTQFRV
jgi:hypothetical protein